GLVGAAVDYSRANSTRTDMQAAIDATALMLSKNAPTMTAAQLQQVGSDFFVALFNRPDTKNLQVVATYDPVASSVTVSVTGGVPTHFMGIFGVTTIDLGTSGTVTWGTSRLRVALVLDNTGSMASANKMTALKTATKDLLTQLKNAATKDGDVY